VATVSLLLLGLYLTNLLSQDLALAALGLVNVLTGLTLFWSHGGNRITAAGIFGLALAVFVGVSALWWSGQSDPAQRGVVEVAAASACCLCAMWGLFWCQSDLDVGSRPLAVPTPLSRDMAIVGAVLSVVTAAASSFTYFFSASVPVQVSLGCMTLLMVSVLLLIRGRAGFSWRVAAAEIVVVLALVGVAAATVFTGYGRLNLVSLGMAGLVVMSTDATRRWLKAGAILAVGPALLVFSFARQLFFEHRYGVTTNGAMSVFTPLRDCARLADRVSHGVVHVDWGQNFVATFLFWVPRALWPGKPVGLGVDLGDLLGYAPVPGQSWAATFLGDFVLALGWWSLPLVVLLVGLFVRSLDGWWTGLLRRGARDPVWFLQAVLCLLVIADLANYAWGGSFDHVSRVVSRSLPLLGLLVLLWFGRRGKATRGWVERRYSTGIQARRDPVEVTTARRSR
jgi:hypothetical protein